MLLIVVVLWMCRSAAPRRLPFDAAGGTLLFFAGLLLVVLFLGLWSRNVATHLRGANLHRSLRRFHNSIVVARFLIPVWFGVAIFVLGWGDMVEGILGPITRWPVELPGLLLGTLPAMGAWMALWWAQFPADRALREQSILLAIDEDLPIHPPPGFWRYFISNLRLQLLFTIVPVCLIVLVHDLAAVLFLEFAGLDLRSPRPGSSEGYIELLLQLISIGLVVLFAPEVLRRILHTQSLPASPLRARLEDLCRRTGLKYRDILLWSTDNNMGNAAVMGVVPQMRYILLSDMLLETMTDQQIEAVFAHEIGHVKHWHMGWYAVLIATLVLIGAEVERMMRSDWVAGMGYVAIIGGFFLVFGYLSRWFERQADVFAARIIEHQGASHGHVGPTGAAAFTSALHRVAVINNIPLAARNFTHGSIADRVQYLNTLSTDPVRTRDFDRWMSVLYASLVLALIVCSAWVMVGLTAFPQK